MPVCCSNSGTTSWTKRVSGTLSMRMLIVWACNGTASRQQAAPSSSFLMTALPDGSFGRLGAPSLERTERQTLDQIFTQERQEHEHRQHREQGRRREQRDLNPPMRLQCRKADRQRLRRSS